MLGQETQFVRRRLERKLVEMFPGGRARLGGGCQSHGLMVSPTARTPALPLKAQNARFLSLNTPALMPPSSNKSSLPVPQGSAKIPSGQAP